MKHITLTQESIDKALEAVKLYLKTSHSTTGSVSVPLPTASVCPKEDRPVIRITIKADAKIKALVKESSKEIAWHGIVEHTEGTNVYTITDILVFPQTVTAATAVSRDEAYGPWIMELSDNVFNKLRFHGHSHVNMGVTPSGVDTNYQETLIDSVQDFYIFAIYNKAASYNIWLYDKTNNMLYEKADIDYVISKDRIAEWAKAQIAEQVEVPAPIYNTGYTAVNKGKTPATLHDATAQAKQNLNTYDAVLRKLKPELYSCNQQYIDGYNSVGYQYDMGY